MSRKDYAVLAAGLALVRPLDRRERGQDGSPVRAMRNQWLADREVIMRALEADNPRFDRERFIEATEA